MTLRVIAVRHGETDWNLHGRIQGHTDIALNAQGMRQAAQCAGALAGDPIDAAFCSDLSRASETARALLNGRAVPLHLDAAFRERHYGVFEGMTGEAIAQAWPSETERWLARDLDFCPHGGESLNRFSVRCVNALLTLARELNSGTVVLVTHGGVLDCLYRAATGTPLHALRTWALRNASINRLTVTGDQLTVESWDEGAHLIEPGNERLGHAA